MVLGLAPRLCLLHKQSMPCRIDEHGLYFCGSAIAVGSCSLVQVLRARHGASWARENYSFPQEHMPVTCSCISGAERIYTGTCLRGCSAKPLVAGESSGIQAPWIDSCFACRETCRRVHTGSHTEFMSSAPMSPWSGKPQGVPREVEDLRVFVSTW